jgi:hypothetical protein
MKDRTARPRKLALKRESLRQMSPLAMREVIGGMQETDACPVSVQVYCTVTVLRGQSCTCIQD